MWYKADVRVQVNDDIWTLQFLFLTLATFPQLLPNRISFLKQKDCQHI